MQIAFFKFIYKKALTNFKQSLSIRTFYLDKNPFRLYLLSQRYDSSGIINKFSFRNPRLLCKAYYLFDKYFLLFKTNQIKY